MQCVSDLFDAAVVDDPYPLYDELRRNAPVCRVPGTDFFLVSTAEAVQEATGRAADFSSNLTAALVQQGDHPAVFDMDATGSARHVLATADDPHHARERKLVLPGLVAKRIRALEPSISEIARGLWRQSARAGGVEWMSAMGDRLPMTLVSKLIGLPLDDVAQLVDWGYGSTSCSAACWPRAGYRSSSTRPCNWPPICMTRWIVRCAGRTTIFSGTWPERWRRATSTTTSPC